MNKLVLYLISFFPALLQGYIYEYFSDGWFSSIHVLIVNPHEHEIKPVKAKIRESVLTLAKRYGAVAAVNGGFWKLSGAPAGILKIDNIWLGTPTKPRGAIGWSPKKKKFLIDKIITNHSLLGSKEPIEVIPASNPPITTPKEWQEVSCIVGGTPLLITHGMIVEDFSSEQTLESFLSLRHARTAVGIRENGDLIFVVVDGYCYGILGGMTIPELASFMKDLGCKEALNLDGGKSSTMVMEGAVVNNTFGHKDEEGKQVEEVSDAILILPASN